MEKKLLSVAMYDEAKNNIKDKVFMVSNAEKKSYHAFKANSIIIEDSPTQPIVTVHGKEIIVEGSLALTLNKHYPINEDFSFNVWNLGTETPNAYDILLEHLSVDGSIDLGFNNCELADFKK